MTDFLLAFSDEALAGAALTCAFLAGFAAGNLFALLIRYLKRSLPCRKTRRP